MPKKMNAEEILTRLAKIREGMPVPQRPRKKRAVETTSRFDARSLEDFEAMAVVEALESMADDVQAVIDEKMERAHEMALDVYYKSVELARDPEHSELVPHVKKMEEAYVRSYGRPIPSKEETEARRRKAKG
jgi:cysteinyl-tRNA synthetase